MKKKLPIVTVKLEKIVGGGQALGEMEDGRKLFVWGGLPGETVKVQLTKKKSSYAEGVVTEVIESSSERIEAQDPDSYMSTSPWQIMKPESEDFYKAALVEEAFELHNIVLPDAIEIYSDGRNYNYRNKVEFSWFGDASSGVETLYLAFFRRGSKGKIAVEKSALLPPEIIKLAEQIRDKLQKLGATARMLKTLLIRCDTSGNCTWQLYVKDEDFSFTDQLLTAELAAQGGEVIYSNPKSPASVITKRLGKAGNIVLVDNVLGVPFRYATEGFFQINLPVYEQALKDMKQWLLPGKETVDLYSGVGTIGLTIGGENTILVEVDEHAVREMRRNIQELGINAKPVLAASEDALEYISGEKTIIVDPPRAGLHEDVVKRLLEQKPERIIYLSCNPVTQARDVERLAKDYGIRAHRGYNFFPRTPHIEHLVILDKKT